MELFVAYDGDDNNNGQSPQTPFRTITKAVATATSGDSIYIKPGVYDATYGYFNNPASGTTWIGDVNGEKFGVKGNVYIVGNYVSQSGNSQVIFAGGSAGPIKNVVFKNFQFILTYLALYNIYVASDWYFENCSFRGNVAEFLGTVVGNPSALYNFKFKNCYFDGLNNLMSNGRGFLDNLQFENCIITGLADTNFLRWATNWTFKNCIIHSKTCFYRILNEGGYPSSLLYDRCIINARSNIYSNIGTDTSKTHNYIINSIWTFSEFYTHVKYNVKRCLASKNPVALGGTGTFSDLIWGSAFVDIKPSEDTSLKRKSLNYVYVVAPTSIKDFFSTEPYKWSYYKPITITNNDNTNYSNVQVKIVVDTASLVSAGKLRSFCEDLRFTDEQGNLLPFWIEYGENTSSTIIWVKIPSLPALGSTTIKMYYGNPYMPRRSDGYNTFEFFDDFVYRTDNYNKWHVQTADNTFSETFDGTYVALTPAWPGELKVDSVSWYAPISRWFKVARPIVIETKCRQTGAWGSYALGLIYWAKTEYSNYNKASYHTFTNGSYAMLRYCDADGTITDYEGGSVYGIGLNVKYINRMILTSSQVKGEWLTESRSFIADVSLDNADWNNCYIGIDTYVSGSAGSPAYYDWIIVRKYMATEPTISIGNEVSGEFYPEGQPDLKDIYGRDPIGTRDIGAIESEYPPEKGRGRRYV